MRSQNIFVFKTNIQNAEQANQLKAFADVEEITDWSTDLEDCDNILRVVGSGINSKQIIQLMDKLGFSCEELAHEKMSWL